MGVLFLADIKKPQLRGFFQIAAQVFGIPFVFSVTVIITKISLILDKTIHYIDVQTLCKHCKTLCKAY
jgi:hypothetical protein